MKVIEFFFESCDISGLTHHHTHHGTVEQISSHDSICLFVYFISVSVYLVGWTGPINEALSVPAELEKPSLAEEGRGEQPALFETNAEGCCHAQRSVAQR